MYASARDGGLPMEPLIEARGVSRAFGETRAVQGLDLQVRPGEIVALLGPDGAGKTTAMRLLCGALRPDSGEVRIGGVDLRSSPEAARSLLGYLPQQFSLYHELTVLENLRFFAEVRGIPPQAWQERSREILRFVELDAFVDRRAGRLSGGMQQKLGLAVALVHQPKLLLLDEPTGGVDPVTRQAFWQLLIRLLGDGVGVLISTPYMDEATRARQVAFLRHGRLLSHGSPRELCRPLQGRMLELTAGPRRQVESVARQDPRVEAVHSAGEVSRIRLKPGAAAAALPGLRERLERAGCTVTGIREVEPVLEDVFASLIEVSLEAEQAA